MAALFDAGSAWSSVERAAYLRGAAAGYRCREREQTVEVVWSGPRTHAVPTRSTGEVLTGLIDRAGRELVLATYSAAEYEPVAVALTLASARGVDISILVETLEGAGSALSGREPAAAFAAVCGVSLWYWPVEKRGHPAAKMHAKIAVADRRELLISSANLTASGVERSIESGVLIRGGAAPERVAQHIGALQANGVLRPLPS